MYEQLAVLALFIFAYGAVAGGIERTWISGPMLYTGFGLLLGPYGLNVFSFSLMVICLVMSNTFSSWTEGIRHASFLNIPLKNLKSALLKQDHIVIPVILFRKCVETRQYRYLGIC